MFQTDTDPAKCVIVLIICLLIFGIVFPGMWFLSDHLSPEKIRIEKARSNRIEMILDYLKMNSFGQDDRRSILKALVLMDSVSEEDVKRIEEELGK